MFCTTKFYGNNNIQGQIRAEGKASIQPPEASGSGALPPALMGVGSGGQGVRSSPWIFLHGTNIVERS